MMVRSRTDCPKCFSELRICARLLATRLIFDTLFFPKQFFRKYLCSVCVYVCVYVPQSTDALPVTSGCKSWVGIPGKVTHVRGSLFGEEILVPRVGHFPWD